MWQQQARAGYAALKQLGVTAGMVLPWQLSSAALDPTAPLLDKNIRWYVENIATDFYSTYHRWSGDRPVNWKFPEVKKRYRDNPLDPSATKPGSPISRHSRTLIFPRHPWRLCGTG